MIPNRYPTLNFDLGETADMIRDTVQGFAQKEIAPLAAEIDRTDVFPRHLLPKMGALGLLGITVEEEWGGSDYVRSGSVGVEISGPIYQGGQLTALRRQAIARRDATRGALADMGHRVVTPQKPHGGGQVIVMDPQSGALVAGSDPRKDGCALGY